MLINLNRLYKLILAVGEAPGTREFVDRYNIEIYANDAPGAVKEINNLIGN